jgi:hypothetical protein
MKKEDFIKFFNDAHKGIKLLPIEDKSLEDFIFSYSYVSRDSDEYIKKLTADLKNAEKMSKKETKK